MGWGWLTLCSNCTAGLRKEQFSRTPVKNVPQKETGLIQLIELGFFTFIFHFFRKRILE